MTSAPSIATMAVFLGCLLLLLSKAEGVLGEPPSARSLWARDVAPGVVHTVRLSEAAPHGTNVYRVQPDSLGEATGQRSVRLRLVGPDEQLFRLADNTVKVDEFPCISRIPGELYDVTVEALSTVSGEMLTQVHLKIIVAEKNQFAPKFERDSYTAEVFRYSDPGTHVLALRATDFDTEAHNRDVSYVLEEGDNEGAVVLDGSSGELTVADGLRKAKTRLVLYATATDHGSPRLQDRANVTLHVRNISEPRNVSIETLNVTTAVACWFRPSYGKARKFEIRYSSKETSFEKRVTIHHKPKRRQCMRLVNLDPGAKYDVEVRAQSGHHQLGMPVKITFKMPTKSEITVCPSTACAGGLCVASSSPPGYKCLCPDGQTRDHCRRSPTPCRGPSCVTNNHAPCSCDDIARDDVSACAQRCRSEVTQCQNGGARIVDGAGAGTCKCPRGFYGGVCQHFDPCSEAECGNGATCRNTSSSTYKCLCPDGYYGATCQHFDPCSTNPCDNGGLCRSLSEATYSCRCDRGYYGDNCTRFDPCSSAPCQNDALCRNVSDDDFKCVCRPGFVGYDCGTYQPCGEQSPCLYGGFCNSVDGSFFCDCPHGRYGRRCEHINLCQQLQPCREHTVGCRNTSDSTFACLCELGWTGDDCATYDPCSGGPCLNGGSCRQTSALTYECACAEPHYGANCETTDHCASAPCENGGTCVDLTPGDYACVCADGFTGKTCDVYDACLAVDCLNGGRCEQTDDGHLCRCPVAYFGDMCQYYNTCHTEPCHHGRCRVAGDGDFSCECAEGYYGMLCELRTPCSSAPCQNDGDCTAATDDSFECTCAGHYYGALCEEYDACHSAPCRVGLCTNVPGGDFHCACPRGLFGRTCESTDPCAERPCHAQATCISVLGFNYTCRCPRGFYGRHCERFDACVTKVCQHGGQCVAGECRCALGYQGERCELAAPCHDQGKPCLNGGLCLNDNNGTVFCECTFGYFGDRCERYDPCSGSRACENGGSCVNQDPELHVCVCQSGFFGRRCEKHVPCEVSSCENNGTCVNTIDGDACYCPPGFTGERCENDINDCLFIDCFNDGSCIDLPGNFRCVCALGFTGRHCEKPAMCPEEVTYEAKGTYEWPETVHYSDAVLECSRGVSAVATRSCVLDGEGRAVWEPPNTSRCDMTIQTPDEAEDILEPYQNGTQSLQDARQVAATVALLEAVLPFSYDYYTIASYVMDIVEQILEVPFDVIAESGVGQRIMKMLERFAHHIELEDHQYSAVRENFELKVLRITWQEHDMGCRFVPQKAKSSAYMQIPPEAFQRDPSLERVTFLWFKTSKLYNTPDDPWRDIGNVISADLKGAHVKDLQTCVEYSLANLRVSSLNRCVFWNTKDQAWSPQGVVTLSYRGATTTCCSSHMTSFAISTDPDVAAVSLVQSDIYLRATAHVCVGIAIASLSVVVVIYTFFRFLNREKYGQTVLLLTSAILMTDLSLLLTNERSRVSSDGACVAMAMFRHFAILHQLLAVTVYARHIVSAITDRSDGDHVTNKHFLLKGALLAYGMPLVLVIISACVDTGAYVSDEHSCRLGSTNLYIYVSAYVTPACLTLLANCCLAVLIIRALLTSHSRKPHDYTISDGQVYVSLVIISETSVTWIMGVISSRHLVETHQFYVTCCYFALRAFLGASALVCFCLLNPDARAVWRQLCRRSTGTLTRRTQYPPGGTAITYKTPASPRGRYVNDYTLVIDSTNGLPRNLMPGDRLSGVPTICINGRRTPSMASMVMGDDDDVSQRAPSVPCSRSGSTSEFGSRIGSFKPTCAFERTDATDNREM